MDLRHLRHTLDFAKLAFLTNQFWLANIPFDLCQQLSWMTCLAVLEGILRLFLTVGSKFYWDKTCFFRHLWHYKLHWNYITWSVMPKPVSLLTVQEAHKEYSSLTDQIRAKYEQLDSGKFGSPGTPAFDAEACESANLLARVSQLCQRLNLPMPKELYRPTFFKHWRHFRIKIYTGRQSWLGYGGCSFVPIDL